MGKVLNSILIHQLPKFWMARDQVVNRLKMVGDKFIRGEVDFFHIYWLLRLANSRKRPQIIGKINCIGILNDPAYRVCASAEFQLVKELFFFCIYTSLSIGRGAIQLVSRPSPLISQLFNFFFIFYDLVSLMSLIVLI